VLHALAIGDGNLVVVRHPVETLNSRAPGSAAGRPQATPSFFCRLVEEVVYWKRSFSPGLT